MSKNSEIIADLIQRAAPRTAVVFSGPIPRLIGTVERAGSAATIKPTVDAMLMAQKLSATYISLAEVNEKVFVLAHG